METPSLTTQVFYHVVSWAWLITVVGLIVQAIRRKAKRRWAIALGLSTCLAIVAMSIAGLLDSPRQAPGQMEMPSRTAQVFFSLYSFFGLAGLITVVGLVVQAIRRKAKRCWAIALGLSTGLAITALIIAGILDSPRREAEQKNSYEKGMALLGKNDSAAVPLLIKAQGYKDAEARLGQARHALKDIALAELAKAHELLQGDPKGATAKATAAVAAVEANELLDNGSLSELRSARDELLRMAQSQARGSEQKKAQFSAETTAPPVKATAGSSTSTPELSDGDAQEFVSGMAKFRDRYNAAPNEIKKSEVFNEARAFEDRFFADTQHEVTDWEGWVERIETNKGGRKLRLRVAIGRNATKITFEQGYGLFDRIKSGTEVYQGASNLREGACVLFSGKVESRERSLSEKGAITAPEYGIVFSSVKACTVSAQPAEPAEPASSSPQAGFDPIGTQKRWAETLVTLKEASVKNKTGSFALLMQNQSDKEETISSLVSFEALSEEGDQGEMDLMKSKCDGALPPKGVFKCKLLFSFENSPKEITLRVGAGILARAVYFKVQAAE